MEYRSELVNRIIKYVEDTYNISGWTYKFMDISPDEAAELYDYLVDYEYEEGAGMIGMTNASDKTIYFFWKGVEDEVRLSNLTHELGHVIHYTHFPHIREGEEKESFADKLSDDILDALEL